MSLPIFTPTPDINKWQMSLCNNSSDNKNYWIQSICTSHHCHIYAPITAFVTFTPYIFDGAPDNHLIWCNATLNTLTWPDLKHTRRNWSPLSQQPLCGQWSSPGLTWWNQIITHSCSRLIPPLTSEIGREKQNHPRRVCRQGFWLL